MAKKKSFKTVATRRIKRTFYLFTRYPLEFLGAAIFCPIFRLIPIDWASAIGGWVGRHVGPHLKVSWIARYNLMKAFPEKTVAEIDEIVVNMWDNLVRTFVEYPHLAWLCSHYEDRLEFVNPERCLVLRDDGEAGIMFSAHIGNWETSSVFAVIAGIRLNRIYRPANNPYVEWVFRLFRRKNSGILVPKGTNGFRQIVQTILKKEHCAMMVDQRLSEGIPVKFFGYRAMTAPSLAALALKYDCPTLPVRSERLKGAHYRVTFEQPIQIEKTGDYKTDTLHFMEKVNQIVENWIREDPAQWLWVHKRWEDSKKKWLDLYKQRHLWKKGIKPEEVFHNAIKNRRL